MGAGTTYDGIGRGYDTTRIPDPRIAAQLRAALGDARSVVNVGAGTGAYEPPETVLAVEPSAVMRAQRPAGAAPVVVATAEALPLDAASVDAALAILTLHHWHDVEAGVSELVRVARRRVLIPHDCSDGFAGAYWRRPAAYLDPAVRAGMSVLAQPGEAAIAPGIARLAADLASGAWAVAHEALLELEAFDCGYRLAVAEL